jgi:hypothetical protein
MDKKLTNINEKSLQITNHQDCSEYKSKPIYLRDDHCDWGSSGMSELIKALDDSN